MRWKGVYGVLNYLLCSRALEVFIPGKTQHSKCLLSFFTLYKIELKPVAEEMVKNTEAHVQADPFLGGRTHGSRGIGPIPLKPSPCRRQTQGLGAEAGRGPHCSLEMDVLHHTACDVACHSLSL